MKVKNWVIQWILAFVLALAGVAFSQIKFEGNSYLEFSSDRETHREYFEDWTDIYLSRGNWRLGLRYELHLPPQLYSQDTTGQGISQRFLEYRKGNLTMTLGNFYSLFGRGLVLRSFENRTLRWDTNIDGARFEYHQQYLDFTLLGGRPRDRSGRRHEVLQGAEVKLKPVSLIQVGGTFLNTRLKTKGRLSWGSVFGRLDLDWGNFYAERAFKDFPDTYPEGKAYYLMGNIFVGPVTLLAEYRDYDQFDLTEALTYNNPPSVVREHLYTLLNRHQHVQAANDEKGYLVELTYSPSDWVVATLNHSRTENHAGQQLYREYYGQLEADPMDDLNLVGAGGIQEDPEARYLNLVGSVKWGFGGYDALKVIYEHQHVTISLTDRQFYNQALLVSLDHASTFTFSLLGERTTDQISDRKLWVGGQVDVHFLENFDLSVFGGRRREGKICAGGVCIYRPVFEGIEVRLINRF